MLPSAVHVCVWCMEDWLQMLWRQVMGPSLLAVC